MMVIANVFPKLQTVKILVRAFSKKRRFRKCFDSQHVKVSQIGTLEQQGSICDFCHFRKLSLKNWVII